MKIVAITVDFDTLHDGHIEHIREASKLGDYLIVIVDSDEALIKKRGYAIKPLSVRLRIALGMRYIDRTIPSIDEDGTCAKTLKIIKPIIFAKGGDRTPDNMPKNEIEVCKEIGCEIVYGVGRKLNSSQELFKEACLAFARRKWKKLS